jgi:hypothetical protein
MMHSDEYDRLYAAFLSMAQQSSLRDVRTRWLALAQDCLSLAKEPNEGKRAEGRSKSILTRLGSRTAIGLCVVQNTAAFFADTVSSFL